MFGVAQLPGSAALAANLAGSIARGTAARDQPVAPVPERGQSTSRMLRLTELRAQLIEAFRTPSTHNAVLVDLPSHQRDSARYFLHCLGDKGILVLAE